MPGIVGLSSWRPAKECEAIVAAMVESMEYESFYKSGTHFVPEFGIYAGWVAQEGSFAADQVFVNESQNVVLLFSGECFADPDTSCQLRRKGHRLGDGAAGWLVHFYEEEGDRFVEKLSGTFSGLLIDKRRKKAFLFNSRYGFERIYWHETADGIYFASEAKALLRVLSQLRDFDELGVAQFLTYGCSLDWRTLFKGIQLLPGGSSWTFEAGACTKRQYFDYRRWESLPSLSPEDFESSFEDTFKRVLPRYLGTHSNLGISLTGGLDTRMIMACLPRPSQHYVSYTFSGKEHQTLDDRIAARVAKACGLEHHLLRLNDDFFSGFGSHADRTVHVTDGSFGIIGTHEIYLNKQARQLAPVRLTGLCGSEILRGVSNLRPERFSPLLVSPEFRQLLSTSVSGPAGDVEHPVTFAAFRDVPWSLYGSAAASRSQVTLRTPFLDNEIVALAFQAPEILRESPRPALRLVENNNKRLREIPTDRRLEGKNGGVINRLKQSLFEVSFKLDYLHSEGMPNWLLPFQSVLDRIDSKVRIFGHHKFLHYRSWFQRELADYVKSVVADARFQRASFWNFDFLERLAADHISGRKNYVWEINAFLTLEAVERLLFKGQSTSGSGRVTAVSSS